MAESGQTERWGIAEFSFCGPREGNPFLDVQFGAQFQVGHRTVDVEGFYDGEGVYRVRFMPDREGTWRYVTKSDCSALDGRTGEFACVAPSPGNHESSRK